MALRSRHSFHLVDNSPWPVLRAAFAMRITIRGVAWFRGHSMINTLISIVGLFIVSGL